MYSENISSFLTKSLISRRLGAAAPSVCPPTGPVTTKWDMMQCAESEYMRGYNVDLDTFEQRGNHFMRLRGLFIPPTVRT